MADCEWSIGEYGSCRFIMSWSDYTEQAGENAMDTDDLKPLERPKERLDLEVLSIEALQERIGELEVEISLIREMVRSKEQARSSADSVFK